MCGLLGHIGHQDKEMIEAAGGWDEFLTKAEKDDEKPAPVFDTHNNWHECPYCLEDMIMSIASPRKVGNTIERMFFCKNENCELMQILITIKDNQ